MKRKDARRFWAGDGEGGCCARREGPDRPEQNRSADKVKGSKSLAVQRIASHAFADEAFNTPRNVRVGFTDGRAALRIG